MRLDETVFADPERAEEAQAAWSRRARLLRRRKLSVWIAVIVALLALLFGSHDESMRFGLLAGAAAAGLFAMMVNDEAKKALGGVSDAIIDVEIIPGLETPLHVRDDIDDDDRWNLLVDLRERAWALVRAENDDDMDESEQKRVHSRFVAAIVNVSA